MAAVTDVARHGAGRVRVVGCKGRKGRIGHGEVGRDVAAAAVGGTRKGDCIRKPSTATRTAVEGFVAGAHIACGGLGSRG
eukprot:CAMPEP_0175077484 /NCGR_PEP_ID=MMETSP0052_2-20121109/23426_1 /TAXON_ID=51329 ORGANISM="Polytomella parva, Strain SAG 63-3" /NCGR_SAMPLE_ID=MMETSP0052_2 /ASSEMBLY_ACC=CAM_ASM_000194 /LENGTH=79 /DNA_ID=CAMNT_0016346975 /DNA_START=8 /DNA_END=244 /DNA_ORIENTATION=+